MKKWVVLFVMFSLLIPAAAAMADEAQVNRYVEMMRQDIRDQKEDIIREAIVFGRRRRQGRRVLECLS